MKILDTLSMTFERYMTQVKSYMQENVPNFSRIGNSSVIGQLINVIGASVNNVMIYLQDAFAEQNKYTAQRKKSIYGLAAQTGFNASLGYAAGMNFRMTYMPNNVNDLTYILKNKTKVLCTQNGLTYNIILPQENVIFTTAKDMSSKQIYAVEGTFETQEFISTGGQLYSINVVFNGDCDISYTEVYVNDELWTRRESLYDMAADGKEYVIHTSLNKGFDIIFGNDNFGRSLKVDDKITVNYLTHNGELGNIDYSLPVSIVFSDPIVDASGNEIDADEVFNIEIAERPANNGTYSDKTDFVKEMIGYNSRAMVLADEKNYKLYLNRISFVGWNHTWSEEGSLVVNSIILKNYKTQMENGDEYFNLKEKDFILSDEQKKSIQTSIKNSGTQLAGTVLNIFDPKLVKYAVYVYIKMNDVSYDKTLIQDTIHKLIGQFMGDIDSDTIIAKSDIVHLLKSNIENIDSVDIYFLSERNEKAIIDGKYTIENYIYNPKTKLYDTKSTTYSVIGDPGLGLDAHGNIFVESVFQFPVLMGGWQYVSSSSAFEKQYTTVSDPVIIVFE